MIGSKAEFIGSAVRADQYPKGGLPEVALVGRSNVGKSSFINSMLGRKNLARTSSKPGKTATLNFYQVEEHFLFVDLPGYGYAAVSKKEKEAWGAMIETYLKKREPLRLVIQLVDIRHPPGELDRTTREWLRHLQVSSLVVATKADKISRGAWAKHLRQIREGLSLQGSKELLLYSAETKEGRDEVWKQILASLPPRAPEEKKGADGNGNERPPLGQQEG